MHQFLQWNHSKGHLFIAPSLEPFVSRSEHTPHTPTKCCSSWATNHPRCVVDKDIRPWMSNPCSTTTNQLPQCFHRHTHPCEPKNFGGQSWPAKIGKKMPVFIVFGFDGANKRPTAARILLCQRGLECIKLSWFPWVMTCSDNCIFHHDLCVSSLCMGHVSRLHSTSQMENYEFVDSKRLAPTIWQKQDSHMCHKFMQNQ